MRGVNILLFGLFSLTISAYSLNRARYTFIFPDAILFTRNSRSNIGLFPKIVEEGNDKISDNVDRTEDFDEDTSGLGEVCDLTEEDLDKVNEYLNDLRNGVYGEEGAREIRRLEKEYDEQEVEEDTEKPDIGEIMNTNDVKFEAEMNKLFNFANLPVEDGKELNYDELEERVLDMGRKTGIDVDELRTIVNSIYRKRGLFKEPFKIEEVGDITLNWSQDLNYIDIWFAVDEVYNKEDFDVTFLPSKITIQKKGHVILDKELFGKLDCDGCFWTLYKNPSGGERYMNVSLTKRRPVSTSIWESLFLTTPSQH